MILVLKTGASQLKPEREIPMKTFVTKVLTRTL